MPLLNEDVQKQVRQIFEEIKSPVTIVMFTQSNDGKVSIECQMCADTRMLLEEVSALSDKITLEVRDLVADEQLAQTYRVDKIPAIVLRGGLDNNDYGIRFYGIPSGYEFGSLIEGILLASKGSAELSPKTMEAIQKLDRPVHIQVYVTPT